MNVKAAFTILLVVNLVGTVVNHIDDTDETYGYWEPLHYLSNRVGLQTWEYSPLYAIRTYSFIFPVYAIVSALQWASISKLVVFKTIKGMLGLLAAYSGSEFVDAVSQSFGQPVASLTITFMVLSPGIFFCSTSYLPSAVCMSLLMLSITAWLRNKFVLCIFWGSVAVLCTGWPFVGLLFLPLGLHMVACRFVEHVDRRTGTFLKGALQVVQLACSGVALIALIQTLVFALDYQYYNRLTSPTLNILLYNAIGGSGDELYGIEPVSYYIKNLFLNLGLSWVLVLLVSPFTVLVSALLKPAPQPFFTDATVRGMVIYSQAAIWILVLFSRPHKEERFLYPIYPLLAFIGACTLHQVLNILTPPLRASVTATVPGDGAAERTTQLQPAHYSANARVFRSAVKGLCVAVSAAMFTARVTSNFTNFGGYMRLWETAGRYIEAKHKSDSNEMKPISVCTGGEWYQFPSHFHLPSRARLQFISDGFGGILPQHFAEINGTWVDPPQEFNDRNTEVRERYIPLEQCDYLVLLIDRNKVQEDSLLRRQLSVASEVGSVAIVVSRPQDISESHSALEAESSHRNTFRVIAQEFVVAPEHSTSALYHAYYVPFKSATAVKFKDYVFFERE